MEPAYHAPFGHVSAATAGRCSQPEIIRKKSARWGGPATRLVEGQGKVALVAARPGFKSDAGAVFLQPITAEAHAYRALTEANFILRTHARIEKLLSKNNILYDFLPDLLTFPINRRWP